MSAIGRYYHDVEVHVKPTRKVHGRVSVVVAA
jgi:hypothetical protein